MSELGNIIQGGGIVLSGAVVLKLIDVGFKAWSARHQKSETTVTPNPLNVMAEKKPRYVSCEECAQRHAEVDKQFAALSAASRDTHAELAAIRHEIQAGFSKLNDRISPVAEACAANSAAIQIMLKGPAK